LNLQLKKTIIKPGEPSPGKFPGKIPFHSAGIMNAQISCIPEEPDWQRVPPERLEIGKWALGK
jgi:hypothetical protein